MAVVIETTIGDITIDLYIQERPRTCLNFLKLCKTKYYNFSTFHKIERNFIAQTGDPTGTGRGGESVFFMLYGEQAKFFDAEVSPRLKHQKLGTVSMVNNGDNVHGSQFFITLGEDLDYLDGVHTVFGEVSEGLEVLAKLNDAICDEEHRPFQDILITHTVILDDPYDDPPGLTIPDRSPEPTSEHLKSSRIGATEDIDDTKGKSLEEIEEEIKTKEAKARATILEMIGDIPDVDVKPPDTVLFVCKLNPVTTAEDLEVIFSRFGVIKSCEVICDKKTGESLQYAFIEFERPEDCENAYFKMDNVLIDDRRIHVDFSQSVSKIKWQRGRETENKNKSNYVIKESAQSMKDDRYQMVFDNEDDSSVVKVPKKKAKKAKYKEASPVKSSDKELKRRSHKKHRKRQPSSSESDSGVENVKLPSDRPSPPKYSKVKQESNSDTSDSESKVKNKDSHIKESLENAKKSKNSSSDSDSEKLDSHDKSKKKRKSKLPLAYRRDDKLDSRSSKSNRDNRSSSESPSRGSSRNRSQYYDRSSHFQKSGISRSRSPRSSSRSRDYAHKRREGYYRESSSIHSRFPDVDKDRRKWDDSESRRQRHRSRTPPRVRASQSVRRSTPSSRDYKH